jgi:hypothetical protein
MRVQVRSLAPTAPNNRWLPKPPHYPTRQTSISRTV